MTSRLDLLRLLAALDQQLAEAQNSMVQVPLDISAFLQQSEIIEGLREARANVEYQLKRNAAIALKNQLSRLET